MVHYQFELSRDGSVFLRIIPADGGHVMLQRMIPLLTNDHQVNCRGGQLAREK